MKYKVCLILIAFGYCLSGCGMEKSTKKLDFSGAWKLDFKKSSLQTPLPKSMIFVIDHKEPNWEVKRTYVYEDGEENIWEIKLTTDGKKVIRDFGKNKGRVRLYWDNEILIFDSEIMFPNETASNVVRYSLTDNGKTFIAEETFKSKSHSHYNRYIFYKE